MKVVDVLSYCACAQIGDAMAENPGYLQVRRIDAAREISATIAKSQNHFMLDADTLLLNLGQHSSLVSGTQ